MENKKKILIIGVLLICLSLLYLYKFSFYPFVGPLTKEWVAVEAPVTKAMAIGMENKGIGVIGIKQINVNNGEEPIESTLIDTRKKAVILADPDNINYISLAQDYILPKYRNNEDIQYGLYIRHHDPIEMITIIYCYLGVNYTLEHSVGDNITN